MNKKIMALWCLLVILFLTLILLIGLKEKDFNYIRFEFDLKRATKKYIDKNNITPKIASSIIVDVDDLVESNYIKKDKVKKYCIKSVFFSNRILFDKYKIEKECEENN